MPPKSQAKDLVRSSSFVTAVDKEGNVYKGFTIWSDAAPAVKEDPDLMFAQCLVLPGSTEKVFKCRQMVPPDPTDSVFEVKQHNAFNFNANLDHMSFSDIGMIPHTNIPCVMDFISRRFVQGQIYSTADPLLVAMNPFKDLGNTTDAVIKKYRDASDVSKLPSHVFTIARTAFENLHGVRKSQTIIVCGESGAGKTEATKQIMRYFASAKGGNIDLRIQKAVLSANPVLEAFGNAKTLRNNNSSRFGRFMQLSLAAQGGIQFGSVQNFLLEKSRLVTQDDNERSYHIFYQLLKGADSNLRSKLKLKSLSDYHFINPKCTDAPGIDDLEEWREVDQSLVNMGLSHDEKETIYSIVAGVMTLGNVRFIGVQKHGLFDAAEIDSSTKDYLKVACDLLHLKMDDIEEGMLVKYSKAGGEVVKGRWKKEEAEVICESLAKAIYDKLFSWIVMRLNQTIEPQNGFQSFMGMLDIFGFEVFKNNSLEQLFINITNEMLQKNFIDVVFERETKLYREEGISAADLQWTTNKEVIDMLVSKKASLMSALEDQCLAPGGSDEKFLSSAAMVLKGNPKFAKAKVASNTNFLVVHTIGEIQYNVGGFLFKNKDVLRPELAKVVLASNNTVSAALFSGMEIKEGTLAKGSLISNQFLRQLESLMALINQTEPHFIRCVKPNEQKAPLKFTPSKVLIQLHALSILEALQLRNLGYSYRRPFNEFLYQFKFCDLGVAESKTMEPKAAAEKLLKGAHLKGGWQIGKTMVFMKPETTKELMKRQRDCLAAWEPLTTLIEAMYVRKKLSRQTNKLQPSLVRTQAHMRKCLRTKVPTADPTRT